jgi:DinB superfamily
MDSGGMMQETVEQYRERMFSHIKGNDPMTMLAAAPRKLERLVKGISRAKASKRPAPGKWSINEILAHLFDTELVTGYRMRTILGAPGSPLQAFDQDAWAEKMHYHKRDARKSFEQFRALREANLALLKTLTPEQWKQSGIHAERGEQSIETLVKMQAGHDINHMQQIERILSMKK